MTEPVMNKRPSGAACQLRCIDKRSLGTLDEGNGLRQ